ncbi:MAG TPA: porin family protein [Candidatus Aquabacterium excrementipullorum]|nr:porin family protein [Candidatus Aquabacterium excrementipullorum]
MKKYLVAGALLASMGGAFAQGYAGALIGLSHLNVDDCSVECDDSGTAGKVYAGGDINRFFGVEVAYIDFGHWSWNGAGDAFKARANAYVATTVWKWNFAPRWTGAAKAGFAVVEARIDRDGQGERDTRTAPYFGLGVDYAFARDWRVVGQFDLTTYNIGGDKGGMYLLGAGVQKDF